MPWFRVDDSLGHHTKAIAAGNAALGLWVRAGAWSAQQLTDGYIPNHVLRSLGTRQQAQKLVDAGLWIRTTDGHLFHQWDDRQPSRAATEKKRQAWRDRQNKRREKGDDT
ncbi:MAG: hypothetical protein ACRDQA_07555 [Nocardioidaceae bacterium]